MNRREFLKISCSGLITLYLSGCGLNMQSGQNITSAAETAYGKENSKMKIIVITGSPHKAGTSALLADKFIAGAEKNGHKVFRFNAAFKNIHACTGCNACVRFCKMDCQKVNDRECINCGECKKICPEGAINFKTKF